MPPFSPDFMGDFFSAVQSVAVATLMNVNVLPASSYVVAPSGSDSNLGTLSAPFATLAKCAAAMETGSIKLCYVRGGVYTPSPSTATGLGCNHNAVPANLVVLKHSSGDDGETFAYYPPDGVDSAIFDGGASSSTTGISTAFCLSDVNNVTIDGLAFQHFQRSSIAVVNWAANNGTGGSNLVENNLIQNSGFISNPAIDFSGWVQGSMAYNNAIVNVFSHGIGAFTAQSNTVGGLTGLVIDQNVVINACTGVSDCGSVYIQDYQSPRSTQIEVEDNYLYQSNVTGSGGKLIYLDDGTSNVTARSNLMIAAGALYAGVQIHGGSNDMVSTNVLDLGAGSVGSPRILVYQDSVTAPGPMTGNVWNGNFVVCKTPSPCGRGFVGSGSPPTPETASGGTYFNYGTGGAVVNTGSGGANGDSSPTYSNPSLTCWVPVIPGQSSILYGPPGFTIPQTGSAPSWCNG